MYDPIEDHRTVYETYRTGFENPYASGYVRERRWVLDSETDLEEELEQLQSGIVTGEPDAPDETQGLANSPLYIDEDERLSDTVEHLDSDIRDILITGTVRPAFSSSSLLIRACVPDSIGLWNPIPGFTSLAIPVSRTKSLGIVRRVNTDYRRGDCPAGSLWCGAQMRTDDHEHPVRGRIRAWDGLIILLRLPVSPPLFISHLLFFSALPSFLFSPIECVDLSARSLSILVARHLTNDPFEPRVSFLSTASLTSIIHRLFPAQFVTLHLTPSFTSPRGIIQCGVHTR